jgi:mannose-6-phosphate isomerase-like protein (cupin superfamily)
MLTTPLFGIHKLSILPNSRCSMHKHHFRRNDFFVISGNLKIEVEKLDYQLVDTTVLGPGDYTSIPPGEFHRFVSGDSPVEALEIYYPEPLSESDIVRKDHGGSVQQDSPDTRRGSESAGSYRYD